MDPLDAALAPFGERELVDGVRAALVPVVVAGTLGASLRRGGGGPAPAGGLALAAAALTAYGWSRDVPTEVVLGIALCALGGLVLDLRAVPPTLASCALAPGALMVAGSSSVDLPGDRGLRSVAVFFAICAGGALVGSFDRRWRRLAPGPAMLAISAGGVYATVPDTELALATFGAAMTVAVVGWPLRLVRIGGAGAGAAIATMAWAAAVDGAARDGAVIGALGCLGLLVIDPVVRMLGERSPLRHFGPVARVGLLTLCHAVVVLWMARVAGLRQESMPATVLAGVGFFGAGAAWAAGGRRPELPFDLGSRRYSPRR